MRSHTLLAFAAASGRELVRDRKTLFYVALFPFCLLAVFLGMAAVLPPSPAFDRSRFFLANGLFIALASAAFFGVAAPLVALRERGTLRLLSTTPVSRLTIMLAHVPARVALALAQTIVIAMVSAAYGYLPVARVGSLLLTSLAGIALLTPLGFLLASFLPSAEAATNVLTFTLLGLVAMAGLFVPLELLPDAAREILSALPPGLLGNAIQHDLTGTPATQPTWVAWLAAVGAGAVLTLVASLTFRWDDGER